MAANSELEAFLADLAPASETMRTGDPQDIQRLRRLPGAMGQSLTITMFGFQEANTIKSNLNLLLEFADKHDEPWVATVVSEMLASPAKTLGKRYGLTDSAALVGRAAKIAPPPVRRGDGHLPAPAPRVLQLHQPATARPAAVSRTLRHLRRSPLHDRARHTPQKRQIPGASPMNLIRHRKTLAAGCTLALLIAATAMLPRPAAAELPFRNGEVIRLIVPYGPGGGFDRILRVFQSHLEQALNAMDDAKKVSR